MNQPGRPEERRTGTRRRQGRVGTCGLGLAGLAAWSMLAAAPAGAQDRGPVFDGVYVGVSIGFTNIIGGALVNGKDYLAQESRPTVQLFGGWRKEFDNGLVLGVEGGFGWEDGDLSLDDPAQSLHIDYSNNLSWRYGGLVGWRTTDRSMVFGYLSETKRDFDVSGRDAFGTFQQSDGQGLLRYGVGAELDLNGPFDLRATMGSSRAKFDKPLNRDPDHPIDFEVAALRQF